MPIGSRHIGPGGIDVSKIAGGGLNADPWSTTYYVQSTHTRAADSGNHGKDKFHPLKTLRQALTLVSVGDRIVIGPTHAETISTNLAVNVVGLKIIGLGSGSQRPKFTIDTGTGITIAVSAAGCLLENLHFAPGIDAVVALVTLTANDQEIVDCLITHDATFQAVDGIAVGTSANVRIIGLRAQQVAAGATSCISFSTGADFECHGCHLDGDYSAGCIDNTGVATRMLIAGNWLNSLNAADVCIALAATSDGRIADNRCRIATDVQVTWITVVNDCDLYENYGVNLDAETGKLIGTVSV